MTYESQVKAAKGPAEGMAVLARGIDEILKQLAARPAADDGWGDWSTDPAPAGLLTVEEDEHGDVTVVLAGVSDEKYAGRRSFSESTLQLHHHIDTEADIHDAYGKGGPTWLYTGNRELFMSYDPTIRAMMVQDVMEDDPDLAYDMGRDVLKDSTPGEMPAAWGAAE